MDASIRKALGDKADYYLGFSSPKIGRDRLHLPGPDFVDRIFAPSDRNNRVLTSLQRLFSAGRLSGTGYLSILPVDQGIEHSAGASFAKNPDYFDAENIVRLAIEGGCNAVASTYGVLGIVARRYAHKIPFIVKMNHNELLTYPNKADQILFGTVKEAADMGAAAVGATIYFGSEEGGRQIVEIAEAFHAAHERGLATVLWCYLRNPAFKKDKDYHVAADLTGQANHLGVTIQADIIKQKAPGDERRLQGAGDGREQLRQAGRADVHRAIQRSPDRPLPVPGRELLHGARGAHQLGRRFGRQRFRGRRHDGGDQQARRRDGADLRTQGVPAADGGGGQAPERHPGRLSLKGRHGRLASRHLRHSDMRRLGPNSREAIRS